MKNDPKNKPDNAEKIGDIVTISLRGHIWCASFQINGKQRRTSLRTTSKKEAKRKAIKLAAELLEGRYVEQVKAPSIKLVTDRYSAFLRTEGKAKKTLQKVDLVVRRVLGLAERRNATTLLDVNLQFVDAFRAERAEAGAMPKTLLNQTVIIRQIVNFALDREMIKQDPLRRLKLKKVKSASQPCWTRPEVNSILAAADERYRTALTILAETGMRIGELKHLTWDDVDVTNRVLRIRAKAGWKPKSGDERAVPITPRVQGLLETQPRSGSWVVTAPVSKSHSQQGRQVSERRLLQHLKGLVEQLGLKGHLHTFRHAFISHALTAGIPEAIVRQWVGHVDADVMKLYTHIADASSQAAMQRLAAANDQPHTPTG